MTVAAAVHSADDVHPTTCAAADGTHGIEGLAHVQLARRLHICKYIEKQGKLYLIPESM